MYVKKEEKYTKSVRPKARKEFIYNDLDGNPLVKVTRIDDGDGKKQFYQSHWNSDKWAKGVPEEFRLRIRLYRISDAVNQNAIIQGKSAKPTRRIILATSMWISRKVWPILKCSRNTLHQAT